MVVPHPEREPEPRSASRGSEAQDVTARRTGRTTHRFTRGFLLALLLSVPFWALVVLAVWLTRR